MPKGSRQGKEGKAEKKQKLTDKERVDKGGVLVRTIIEVLGAPKEYVEDAIKVVVDKLHKTDGLEVVSESTYEAEEKGKLFSTFSEIEIWFKDVDALSKFIFDFTPSSVEVVQPSKLSLSAIFVSGFMNDFLLKMHDMGLKLKDTAAKSQLLQKNTDALVRNFFNFILKEPKSAEEVAKLTGIPNENAEAILSNFMKAGVVEKKEDRYVLLKKQ
ncbi:MAG: hypothetical protein KKD17_01225 [Nanoarchaeota archaeon]|nr:hypothetical protein [Nanoarchaeota archaeon]